MFIIENLVKIINVLRINVIIRRIYLTANITKNESLKMTYLKSNIHTFTFKNLNCKIVFIVS